MSNLPTILHLLQLIEGHLSQIAAVKHLRQRVAASSMRLRLLRALRGRDDGSASYLAGRLRADPEAIGSLILDLTSEGLLDVVKSSRGLSKYSITAAGHDALEAAP